MRHPDAVVTQAARLGPMSIGVATRAFDQLTYLAGFTWIIVVALMRPSSWRQPVREVLSRQIFFTGVQALGFVAWVAIAIGLGVVLQTRIWFSQFGQSALLGPVLVVVIVRELAPLLVSVIVIVRSGSAIATELGTMSLRGELEALEVQGIDPVQYLVVPRTLGVIVSVLCLTVFFDLIAFATGYAASVLMELNPPRPAEFFRQLVHSLRPSDVAAPVIKSILPPLLVAAICCHVGLHSVRVPTDIPKAVTRALSISLMTVVVTSLLVSAIGYP